MNVISVFGHNSGFDLKLIDINLNEVYGIGVDTSRDSKLCCLDLNNLDIYYEGYK